MTWWCLEKKLPAAEQGISLVQKLVKLDPLHMIPLSSSLILLFVTLETGGVSLPWSDIRVWGCLVASILLGMGFCYSQYKKGDE